MSFFDDTSKTKIVCKTDGLSGEIMIRFWLSSREYLERILGSNFFIFQDSKTNKELVLKEDNDWLFQKSIDNNNITITYPPVFKEMISKCFLECKPSLFDFLGYNRIKKNINIENGYVFQLISELNKDFVCKWENESLMITHNDKTLKMQIFIVNINYFKHQDHLHIVS